MVHTLQQHISSHFALESLRAMTYCCCCQGESDNLPLTTGDATRDTPDTPRLTSDVLAPIGIKTEMQAPDPA